MLTKQESLPIRCQNPAPDLLNSQGVDGVNDDETISSIDYEETKSVTERILDIDMRELNAPD